MPYFEKGNKKILFIHIPKTGGTSIEEFLKKNQWKEFKHSVDIPPTHGQHAAYNVWKEWGDFDYKFTSVREPISRIQSNLVFLQIPNDSLPNHYELYQGGKWKLDTLSNLLELGIKEPERYANIFRPQIDFINEEVEVFYFPEGLKKIRLKLIEEFGCSTKRKIWLHYKLARRGFFEIPKPQFNDEQKNIIRKFYKEDYLKFFKEDHK